ncbi:phosphatase PAP2 family protein [Siphonobacter sp. SORGH_AS_1065]|uniref:phosphatase PAP2 family protein n=1 Tax=Siphonobacter sp. SORGH_AS_1065 TaxID=3041795 RepID=UPI0027881774|nr:phosphatase PAP2 family protein [Siphonobacter sp. SORGH_AS_1065]MDQ1088925.1 undecaprenyl-diphosphatase [Siphonobacter sp. SORGH_AS_1065]
MLNELDTELFLALNGAHASWLDQAMFWISDRNFWFPFYALILLFLIWRYRIKAVGIILTCVLAILVGDQITSSILKPWAARPRPCHEPSIENMVHVVWECGGMYGFASSHAANTFGFVTVLVLLIGKEYPWLKWLYVWAALVSYSRIYVGAHYPGDVLVGGTVGILGAVLVSFLYRKLPLNYQI